MANIAVSNIGETSFRARVENLMTSYDKDNRTIWWELYKGSTLVSNPSQSLGARVSNSSYKSFSGLSSGTSYKLYCYIDYTNAEGEWMQSSLSPVTVTTATPTPTVTIDEWDWTTTNPSPNLSHNADASATLVKKAKTALDSKQATTNFDYRVWNDLVYKVSEARYIYKNQNSNYVWNNYYATRDNTLMSSSSKRLTATRYNSLRYNLGEYYSTGISEVSSGDPVYATTHFKNFVTKLNEFISRL